MKLHLVFSTGVRLGFSFYSNTKENPVSNIQDTDTISYDNSVSYNNFREQYQLQ